MVRDSRQGLAPLSCDSGIFGSIFLRAFLIKFAWFTFSDLEQGSLLRYWTINVYRVKLYFAIRLDIDFLWWYKLFSEFLAHLCLLITILLELIYWLYFQLPGFNWLFILVTKVNDFGCWCEGSFFWFISFVELLRCLFCEIHSSKNYIFTSKLVF